MEKPQCSEGSVWVNKKWTIVKSKTNGQGSSEVVNKTSTAYTPVKRSLLNDAYSAHYQKQGACNALNKKTQKEVENGKIHKRKNENVSQRYGNFNRDGCAENKSQNGLRNSNIQSVERFSGIDNVAVGFSTPKPKSASKKKRHSKIKRQTAFQSGKLHILKPEYHSLLMQKLTDTRPNTSNNAVVDINNFNEYPCLSSQNSMNNQQFIKQMYYYDYPDDLQVASFTEQVTNTSNVGLLNNEMFNYMDKSMYQVTSLNDVWSYDSRCNVQSDLMMQKDKRNVNIHHEDICVTKSPSVVDNTQSPEVTESSRKPIQLFDILANSIPKKKSDGKHKSTTSKSNKLSEVCHIPNVLDSSAPNVKRGKERETPKQKRVSHLKKIILSERLMKKELKASELQPGKADSESTKTTKDSCVMKLLNSEIEIESVERYCELENNVSKTLQLGVDEASEEVKSKPSVVSDLNKVICPSQSGLIHTAKAVVHNSIEEVVEKVEMISINDNELYCNDINSKGNKTVYDANPSIDYNNASDIQNDQALQAVDLFVMKENDKLLAFQHLVHNRSFRVYCNHLLSKDINKIVLFLIDNLARFQDRQHEKDPVKARMKRRLVCGIKETAKFVKLKKLKCVVIAPDLEDIKSEGGINTLLGNLIQFATEYHVPFIFAGGRRHLGKSCHKAVAVSCIGIFNYEGCESSFKEMIELHNQSKKDYQDLKKIITDNLSDDGIKEIFEAKKKTPEDFASYRAKMLKSTLSRSDENSILKEKYGSSAFEWFTTKYMLKA